MTPIRKAYVLNPAQHAVREPIQTAAIAYARTARDSRRDPDPPAVPADEERDRAVPGVRSRQQSLQRTVERLLDPAEARDGLRMRGLSYTDAAERLHMPAEIAAHGLPLNVILLATSRFGPDLYAS